MNRKAIITRLVLVFAILVYIIGGLMLARHNPILAYMKDIKNELTSANSSQPTAPANQPSTPPTIAPTVLEQKATSSSAAEKNLATSAKANSIGIFISNSPDDPAAFSVLDKVSSMGFDVVYNYASFHAAPDQVRSYLDHAQSRGLRVIFSLKDLYDQLPGSGEWPRQFGSYYGATNEDIALNVVRQFKDHPATWGFSISDEAPESPADLNSWRDVLIGRYQKIKAISNKPVMLVLVGHSSGDPAMRRQFLTSLKPARDSFALDYYPYPFESTDQIRSVASDLPAVGEKNGWFVAQSFSWSSYPDTARGLGYNLGLAKLPGTAEMTEMANLALNGGARNILYYSYFDIKDNGSQIDALSQAVRNLRH